MQVGELIPQAFDLVIHGGNIGLILFGAIVLAKVKKRLDRDEDLRSDYPPHRHINGSISYPHEYQPSRLDKLP